MTLIVLEAGLADTTGTTLQVVEVGLIDSSTTTLQVLEVGVSGDATVGATLFVVEVGLSGATSGTPSVLTATPNALVEPGVDVVVTAVRSPAPASATWRVAGITTDGVAPLIRNATATSCAFYAPPSTLGCTVTIGYDPVDSDEQYVAITVDTALVFVETQPSTAWVAL
jgi:hypothetical protein